ncbi:MAG: CDP-diacylglycerol--glycerol-3-phosphate 3-phosphatidyltransferase [Candidatus Saccharicenans sp.]|jgi:CDP-diacylglycerol--glycerol-3-phosphate 3-phosphatidyltransferase|nr:CDP-diacylglycerol--glycerol-3-phosphate 3-phosphatidyltransferase [Candidatus Saccharicenans sp.]MDH7575230.1 CDP-diacylglycerol--glycerol-3-phosphate 3-phosphatidyltransferase [Candidatus Saccharicenans sp.]
MNTPTILTIFRLLAIPVLVVVMLTPFEGHEVIAFTIFVVACLTDMLDGFWARKKKMETVLGSLLDPLADKLLITSALICLVSSGVVAPWMAIIIIGREIAVTGFRAIASSRGYLITASGWGKLKMIFEAVVVSILIFGEHYLGIIYRLTHTFGLWLVVIIALASALEYFIRFGPRVVKETSG